MSIIIQAGHKTSKSKQVMEKLYERGLDKPKESYTHKMTAEQVSETLYKVLVRENMSSANEKMADNVMIDLLLANLDFGNWGWDSDKNLASLEYWQQIEPDVGFILVFDHPKNILKEFTNITLTADMIDQAMDEWVDYHQKMLETLETYEDQAILIEGSCAADNISKLGEQVKSIASGLNLKKHWQVFKDATDSVSDTDTVNQSSAVIDHINNEILKKYPEVIKLFNTLLNKATIKCSEPIYRTKQVDLTELVTVLNNLNNKQESSQYLAEKELLVEQLQHVQGQLEKQLSVHEEYKQQKTKDHDLLEKRLEEAAFVQMEIEKSYNINQNVIIDSMYESSKSDIEDNKSNLSKKDNVFVKELLEKNNLLTHQLKLAQEELEHICISKVEEENNQVIDKDKAIIHSLPKKEVYYGAENRIKQDLPYRLGSRMVKSKKPKDLLFLPISLIKEYKDFQELQSVNKNLPKLEDYQDFYKAERVKNHLSYKLGKNLIEGLKSNKKISSTTKSISKEIIKFKLKDK